MKYIRSSWNTHVKDRGTFVQSEKLKNALIFAMGLKRNKEKEKHTIKKERVTPEREKVLWWI